MDTVDNPHEPRRRDDLACGRAWGQLAEFSPAPEGRSVTPMHVHSLSTGKAWLIPMVTHRLQTRVTSPFGADVNSFSTGSFPQRAGNDGEATDHGRSWGRRAATLSTGLRGALPSNPLPIPNLSTGSRSQFHKLSPQKIFSYPHAGEKFSTPPGSGVDNSPLRLIHF